MASDFPEYAQLANLPLIEEMFARYQSDRESVDRSWRHFFEGIDFATILRPVERSDLRIFELVQAYRRYGHLLAPINPIETGERRAPELELETLGFTKEELDRPFPTLGFCAGEEAPLKEIIAALSSIYCSRIGFEYMDLDSRDLEQWMQKRLEPKLSIDLSAEEKRLILEELCRSEAFETFLHTKFVGQKRFSLEGAETTIPILAEMIEEGAAESIDEFFIGMAHRGRLNVLANVLNKPYSVIFREFEDSLDLKFEGSSDVKYHKGYSSRIKTRNQKEVSLHLAANPSHLESVDPVVLGQTRGRREQKQNACAIIIHGDASIAGQGVVYEAMQLMNLPGYFVGGSIHLVINNQIGFTTLPEEERSTRYCTDIAKAFGAPVFHVNAEDPESCIFAAKMAMQIRQQFKLDVFIDLNCYRKYGHNEGDEPAYTQPLQYKLIRQKRSIREIYSSESDAFEASIKAKLNEELEKIKQPLEAQEVQGAAQPSDEKIFEPFASAVDEKTIREVIDRSSVVPETFHLHPKLQKWLQERKAMIEQGKAIDWATGEHLAFGTLLLQGMHVRLSGQDTRRGTFSQRHEMWIDQENAQAYFPLDHLQEKQGRFDVVNSPLSEFASLAFEYGYTWTYPDALVLWEAQYGDFANGAQIVIDQYITTAEQKWNRTSSLTLLLPHGYEGQGPEHSSARIERFLVLAGNNNIQVVNPTTPAQYFHLLRRQALRKLKKPLIAFTPKGILRLPANVSDLKSFTNGVFEEILDDPTPPAKANRILFCSGKVYYDLAAEKEKRKANDVALIRIEQIYPLHVEKLKSLIGKYSSAQTAIWVQEEPENMGSWHFIRPHLMTLLPSKITLGYAGRERSASPATGSPRRHKDEQQKLLEQAFA